jgi:hypothetical protein
MSTTTSISACHANGLPTDVSLVDRDAEGPRYNALIV